MSDEHFGSSINGNFTNKNVQKIKEKLGEYQYQTSSGEDTL
jgi:hypothetical protein